MNKNKVRVNDFDRIVGGIQTQQTINVGKGHLLLDVGCGIGLYTPMFLKKFEYVTGLDPSEAYIKQAKRANKKIKYVVGYGETFIGARFDTINLNMVLEHVDNPVKLLRHLHKLLNPDGQIVIHVPNANSITRRLGVIMGVIPSIYHISEKERDFYGHKRTYTLQTLERECIRAGLNIVSMGGVLWKPLPNEDLQAMCKKHGHEWSVKFIESLVEFGRYRIDECADIFIVCQ